MTDFKLNTAIKNTLDIQTGGNPNIAYWQEDDGFYYTSRQHLDYIDSIGVYSINVDFVISELEALYFNSTESVSVLEEVIGTKVSSNELEDVNILNPNPGDTLTINNEGKIVNAPAKDIQKIKETEEWSTNDESWDIIDSLYFTTANSVSSSYVFMLNFGAIATSNKTEFEVGIFKEGTLIQGASKKVFFDRKKDTKSVTLLTYDDNIEVETLIEIKIRRTSNKKGYITIDQRTFIIEEK